VSKVSSDARAKKTVSPRDAALAALVASGMSIAQARQSVGLSGHNLPKNAALTLSTMRQALQNDKDLGYIPTMRRIVKRAKSKDIAPSDQNRADGLLLKGLGYEAPAQIHMEHTGQIHTAALVLHKLQGITGLDPAQIRARMANRVPSYTIVEDNGDGVGDKAMICNEMADASN
jgi:hypothetical protein